MPISDLQHFRLRVVAFIIALLTAFGIFHWRRILVRWLRHRLASKLQEADTNPAQIGTYPVVKALSSGLFGTIYLVQEPDGDAAIVPASPRRRKEQFFRKMHGRKLVIKQLRLLPSTAPKAEGFVTRVDALTEVELMKTVRNGGGHANVLPLVDDFMTSKCLNMVLEHADGGDLLSAMEQEPDEKFSEYQSCCYFRQLVAALAFIHRQGLVHRDVSLENLLLCGNQVKLCDFGLAAYHKPMPPAGPGLTELVGKIIYMAPEVYKKRPCYDGRRADAWSAGVCLFIMLTGAPPLSKPNRTDPCFGYIAEGKIDEILRAWGLLDTQTSVGAAGGGRGGEGLSQEVVSLLKQLMSVDQTARMRMEAGAGAGAGAGTGMTTVSEGESETASTSVGTSVGMCTESMEAVLAHPWLADFGSAKHMRSMLLRQRLAFAGGGGGGGGGGGRSKRGSRTQSVCDAEELRVGGRVPISERDFRRWLVPKDLRPMLRAARKVRRDDANPIDIDADFDAELAVAALHSGPGAAAGGEGK